MKIKDTDYLYLSSRIKGIQKDMLGIDGLRKLAGCKNDEDAAKILEEAGFKDFVPGDLMSLESCMDEKRREMFTLLYTYSPSKEIIDVFRLKYDYHNIKSILKANAMGEDASIYLSDASSIEPARLEVIIREKQYHLLSQIMGDAVVESADILSRTGDPQLSDMILDKAYYLEMSEKAKLSESKFLLGLVSLMADLANLKLIVRAKIADKSYDYLKRALVLGGSISINAGMGEITPDYLKSTFAGENLQKAAAEAAGALTGERPMSLLDKECDNAIIDYLKSARLVAFGEAHVIAYIMAFENEIVAIRQVMQGRNAKMSEEEIMERLRESYV